MKRYAPEEFLPGVEVQSEDELIEAIGNIATTIFHPVGTCRMGQDPGAVVGADLRAHGLEGLRIVDASVMPRIVSGNTASPVIMIAGEGRRHDSEWWWDVIRGSVRRIPRGAVFFAIEPSSCGFLRGHLARSGPEARRCSSGQDACLPGVFRVVRSSRKVRR